MWSNIQFQRFTCVNSDDHVNNIHEVWQIVQRKPHRQVAHGNSSEACPEETEVHMSSIENHRLDIWCAISHACTSEWWSPSCRQWGRSWPVARHNKNVLLGQPPTLSNWKENDDAEGRGTIGIYCIEWHSSHVYTNNVSKSCIQYLRSIGFLQKLLTKCSWMFLYPTEPYPYIKIILWLLSYS